jgi:hypothetical protein
VDSGQPQEYHLAMSDLWDIEEEKAQSLDPDLPPEVEEKIVLTRVGIAVTLWKIGGTLQTLEERLRPSQLAAAVKEKIKESTLGRLKASFRRLWNAGQLALSRAGRAVRDLFCRLVGKFRRHSHATA